MTTVVYFANAALKTNLALQATEILLRRLRGQGDGRSSTRSTTSHTRQSPPPTATFPTSMEDVDASSENDCHMGVAGETEGVDFREPPPGYSPAELDALVNIHGYSPEDAAKALTICDEMRRLEAAGVGGVAAAEELTRRVLCGRSAAVNPEVRANGKEFVRSYSHWFSRDLAVFRMGFYFAES